MAWRRALSVLVVVVGFAPAAIVLLTALLGAAKWSVLADWTLLLCPLVGGAGLGLLAWTKLTRSFSTASYERAKWLVRKARLPVAVEEHLDAVFLRERSLPVGQGTEEGARS